MQKQKNLTQSVLTQNKTVERMERLFKIQSKCELLNSFDTWEKQYIEKNIAICY